MQETLNLVNGRNLALVDMTVEVDVRDIQESYSCFFVCVIYMYFFINELNNE